MVMVKSLEQLKISSRPKVIVQRLTTKVEQPQTVIEILTDISLTLAEINHRLKAVESHGICFNPMRIHQGKTIAAGKNGVVYEYDPRPYVALIYYIGCSWFSNTYYDLEIDRLHKQKIERIIGNPSGPTSEPLRLVKPLIVREKIYWKAYNNDTSEHSFEVLNDGILHRAEVAKYLGGQELY